MNLLRHKDIELRSPTTKMEGIYRIRKYKAATHELVQDTGEFKNLIVDAGLVRWCTDPVFDYAFAGTGTSAPSVLNTTLATYVGYSTGGVVSSLSSNSGYPSATPYTQFTRTWRCDPGAVTGNLTEVGVGWSTSGLPTSGTHRVFSRALIVDGGGSPVTLTVLSDEYLDITYTLKLYVPANAADSSYNVTISGTNYAIVARVAEFPASWTLSVGSFQALAGNWSSTVGASAYPSSSVLGPVTGVPTGIEQIYATSGTSSASASSGVVTRTQPNVATLSQANTAGGIGCAVNRVGVSTALVTSTQFSFSPPLPKDGTKILTLNLSQTLTRL